MHTIRKAEVTSPITTLGEDAVRIIPIAAIIGVAGLAGAFFLTGGNLARFSHVYLVNFCFFVTIVLGALFFVLVQHLTRAGWSVTVRRIAEILAACIFPMLILFLPILIPVLAGYDGLYSWNSGPQTNSQTASVEGIQWAANDMRIYELKSIFLKYYWFGLRAVLYFGAWIFIALALYRWSTQQDETGDPSLTSKMQSRSAPMMLFFVAALVFASFDWEMSLAPMWFSTMFPVYFFSGSVIAGLAAITLTALLLQRSGRLTDEITVEHYHDLAKLMFAFIFFWGYIAFSQFMLIWYANFPEETFWYRLRSDNGWLTMSMVLLFGHLFIPFLGLMARTVRRSKKFLLFASIYLLAMHWVDHFWIVMPQLNATLNPVPESELGPIYNFPGLVDALAFVGFAGLFVASFCLIAGNRSLVAIKDPRLHEALNYDNP